jgi:hypothetical protein
MSINGKKEKKKKKKQRFYNIYCIYSIIISNCLHFLLEDEYNSTLFYVIIMKSICKQIPQADHKYLWSFM